MPRIIEQATYVPKSVDLLRLSVTIRIYRADADFDFVFFYVFRNVKLEIPKRPSKTRQLISNYLFFDKTFSAYTDRFRYKFQSASKFDHHQRKYRLS